MGQMSNADEIEYFEFVPISLVKELHDDILGNIEQTTEELHLKGIPCIANRKKRLLDTIASSLSRNVFLFQNLVLKTIFSFPSNFSFERKVTDMRCEANLQKLVDEFFQIIEEEKYLRSETLRLQGEIEAECFRSMQYEVLLKNEEGIFEAIRNTEMLQNLSGETTKVYQGFVEKQFTREDKDSGMAEFKGLRDEMHKKERDDLYNKASVDTLMFFIKNIVN